ncbi:hypothetical protein N2152v2_010587 [Parachlorella kessleri]
MAPKKDAKYVQNMQQSVQNSTKARRADAAEPSRKDKKKAEEERQKELASLFAMAIKQPKVPPGVDPKSIVCEYFRHGQCTKGFKCKFSHDLSVERKTAKIDLYTDKRDGDEEGGMEDWDQETLEKAIREKHGAEKGQPNKTEIICKYFLEAVEKRQYGWFWQCPNGKDCKYRHALPPGYVLKSQMKELLEQEAANVKDAADVIEEERAAVEAKTPITEETFRQWYLAKRDARKQAEQDKIDERKRKGLMTGREIFAEEGFIAQDDLGASDEYSREQDEEEEIRRIQAAAAEALERARSEGQAGVTEDPGALDHAAAAAAAQEAAEGRAGPAATAPGVANGADGGEHAAPAEAAGNGVQTTLQLSEKEQEELFDDDDDDEDLDDEDLDALEEQLTSAALG